MRQLHTLFLILFLLGCDNKQMTIEDTIYEYYETMLQGEMEKSQEFLKWDSEEASIIDYYANMGKLRKEYQIISIENFEIISLSEKDETGKVTVKITYKNKNGMEKIEINKVKLCIDSKGIWRITSIKTSVSFEEL